MSVAAEKAKRPYRMGKRAASTEATRRRIVEAMWDLVKDRWYDEVTLRELAATAGVALQTVVNHFGTKEAILAASIEQPVPEEWLSRDKAKPNDVGGAVRLLVGDYERVGDAAIRLLALEGRIPALRPSMDWGRRVHREWVASTFPAALEDLRGAARERRLDLLVCATDVYTWKLLRRDRRLSQAQTAAAIRQLVEALHR
ncbi:MAG: TetR/AcrR family transcriptional regulator [Solirubrobacterales bacterium]